MPTKEWNGHFGSLLASVNGFDVIDNKERGFAHIIPIPTEEELKSVYRHDYYEEEKPLYLDRYLEDIEWWNAVYSQRYKLLEKFLPQSQRSILDIGSGPGYFLLEGQRRGWRAKGIEPSARAFEHSRNLGLDVQQIFFTDETADMLGSFDVINLGLVLEHIPYPEEMLQLVGRQLNDDGLICIVVPNDFNPIQLILRDSMGFEPWWVSPPHHINYFNFDSLEILLNKCGFNVLHKEATFPIDLFLLMGDNYLGQDAIGRECHKKRMEFEKAVVSSGNAELLTNIYCDFANNGIGREAVFFARKNS